MTVLTKKQLLMLHSQLIAETGGVDGLRDEGMLESAMNAPFQSFAGEEVYPSLQQKAARLCFGLVKNHPFIDGNKRAGTHAMLVIEVDYTQDELSGVILSLAAGEIGHGELLRWVIEHQE